MPSAGRRRSAQRVAGGRDSLARAGPEPALARLSRQGGGIRFLRKSTRTLRRHRSHRADRDFGRRRSTTVALVRVHAEREGRKLERELQAFTYRIEAGKHRGVLVPGRGPLCGRRVLVVSGKLTSSPSRRRCRSRTTRQADAFQPQDRVPHGESGPCGGRLLAADAGFLPRAHRNVSDVCPELLGRGEG